MQLIHAYRTYTFTFLTQFWSSYESQTPIKWLIWARKQRSSSRLSIGDDLRRINRRPSLSATDHNVTVQYNKGTDQTVTLHSQSLFTVDYWRLQLAAVNIGNELAVLCRGGNKNLAIANRSRVSCINTNNNTITLKSGLEVTQGHWKWYYLKAWVRFPIRLL